MHTEISRLRDSAHCLLDYLDTHGKTSRPFEVLRFLAQGTLRRLDEGKDAKFNNFAIKHAVAGEGGADPSAWLSPNWQKLNNEIRNEREEGLQKFAADRGLEFYPWIDKQESSGGAGNQALYFLVSLPIPPQEVGWAPTIELPTPDIRYIPAEKLKPSWWARRLFDQNHVASGWRKGLYIWPSFLWVLVTIILTLITIFSLSQRTTPVTTGDLMAIIVLALLAWVAFNLANRFERLVDDRVIMASDRSVGFREFGVCIELFKPDNAKNDVPNSLRLIKYGAQCPICSAKVLLDVGEPDFPRRIVGRCQESPREHVFSFDRVRRCGYRLR